MLAPLIIGTPLPPYPFRAQQVTLPVLRAFEAARQDLNPALLPEGEDPILALSSNDYRRTYTADYGDESWRSFYRHKSLVHIALLNVWATKAGPAPLAQWLARIHDRDMDLWRVAVAPTHPALAKQVIEVTEFAWKFSEIAAQALS